MKDTLSPYMYSLKRFSTALSSIPLINSLHIISDLSLLLIFLIIPILIDYSLFNYCLFIEKKRLIEFCMNHNPDLSEKEAMSIASKMIDEGFKNHEYIF